MLAHIKAFCLHSLTVAWAYILAGVAAVLAFIDALAALLGQPDISNSVAQALGASPSLLAKYTALVAAITFISRLRSILFPPKAA